MLTKFLEESSLTEFIKEFYLLNSDACICALCGATDGHMPTLSGSGKKMVFGSECEIQSHSLKVKQIKTSEQQSQRM